MQHQIAFNLKNYKPALGTNFEIKRLEENTKR